MPGANRVAHGQASALTAVLLLFTGCMDKLPSAPSEVTSGVTIYEQANFRGTSALLTRDASALSDFSGPCEHSSHSSTGGSSTVHNWSDCISSPKVAPGWRARICVDNDFKGQSLEVSGDVSNLQLVAGSCGHDGLNDCISSIRVWQQ